MNPRTIFCIRQVFLCLFCIQLSIYKIYHNMITCLDWLSREVAVDTRHPICTGPWHVHLPCFNTVLTDPFMSHLATQLGYSAGDFRLCNWLSLRRLVSWINHLPPACWSTFWKSNFKQQLGYRFHIMDNESYFFVFWRMQLYMSWYIRSFFGFTFLNILYFFQALLY